jgi:hypothetical protein
VHRFETVAGRKPTSFAALVRLGTLLRNSGTFNLIFSIIFTSLFYIVNYVTLRCNNKLRLRVIFLILNVIKSKRKNYSFESQQVKGFAN